MAESGSQVVITGQLGSVRVVKHDSGWGFATFVEDDKPQHSFLKVVGVFIGVSAGDRVELTGVHTRHPKYGDQFKASSVAQIIPSDANGVISWLSSHCPGVGEARAREMVKRWPDGQLWEIIEKEPHRLAEIKGIGSARAMAIHDAHKMFSGERDQMIALKQWGMTDYQVSQCLIALKTKDLQAVVDKIRADPYWLCRRVRGFGFLKADAAALKLGVAPDDKMRMQAALLHQLSEGRQGGHVFVQDAKLGAMTSKLVHSNVDQTIPDAAIWSGLKGLARAERVHWDEQGRVYLPNLYEAEGNVAKAVKRLCGR
jgi:exodeoxyribonuclease V alpha subunit